MTPATEADGFGAGGTVEPAGNVTQLFLNLSPTPPAQIAMFALMFPSLSELHLGGNGITSVAGYAFPEGLAVLNLEDNAIADWDGVADLGGLPALASLNLGRNLIAAVGAVPAGHFACVSSLDLSRNRISDWASVAAIASFPAVTELRINSNALFQGKQLHNRQILISRLPNVARLNKTDIKKQERTIAERFYLANHAKEWWAQKDDPSAVAAFKALHPGFHELVTAHGEPEKPRAATVAIKEGFVALRATTHVGSTVKKINVPATTTVAKLRQVLKAKKVVPPKGAAPAVIMYRPDPTPDQKSIDIELDDDMRDLAFYELWSGEIIVSVE